MSDHANFANNLNKHCNMDIPIILAICAQMHNLETLLRFYISMKSNIFGFLASGHMLSQVYRLKSLSSKIWSW